MKLLFFDTETTGLNHNVNGIHQMSGYIVIDNIIVDSFDIKFRPFDGCLCEDGAFEVTGLTEEEVMNREVSEQDALNQLLSIFDKHVNKYDRNDKMFVIGYNINFDINFINEFFRRNNNTFLYSYIFTNPIDVMSLAGHKLMSLRPTMPNFKQGTVAKTLCIQMDEDKLHDALYDVWVCVRIYNLITNTKIKFQDEISTDNQMDRI